MMQHSMGVSRFAGAAWLIIGVVAGALPRASAAQDAAGAAGQPMAFVTIRPGTFMMGCSPGDTRCDPDEHPSHEVRITKPFEIGTYEVTQAQWQAVMGTNPSRFKGDPRQPVEQVSWFDAQEFLKRLDARNDGYRYRLPTEAEWEYAARAGNVAGNTGPLDDVAWHQANAGRQTHPVGLKRPNAWGLYDVEGNVYEWTADYFGNYDEEPLVDPTGPRTGGSRIPRGGSWNSTPVGVRLSNRNLNEPGNPDFNIGFRAVRERLP